MAGRNRAVLSEGSQDALSGGAEGSRYTYLPWVDLICAGVPCQDWSVAGKRGGLSGQRSSLVYQFARILHTLRPTWFLFENVPGLLSSNDGRDFAEVLRLFMVKCGYGIQWRVLDSQFFGVAQRRRRLFIVGRFGKPCPPEILFEPESGSGDSPQGQETWSGVAAPLTSGIGITGNAPGRRREDDYNLAICGTLGTLQRDPSQDEAVNGQLIATAISASTGHHGHSSPRGDGSDNLVATFQNTPEGGGSLEANVVLGREPANGHARLLHAGEGSDDARETEIPMRVVGCLEAPHAGGFQSTQSAARGHLISQAPDADRVRDFAGLPKGLDSPRYRTLGNAVTVNVIEWIGKRIVAAVEAERR